jgi:ankyrin repeat protein
MGNYEIVKLLVENGANIFEKDCDGKTCLHKCVEEIKQSESDASKLKKYLDTLTFILHKEPKLIEEKDNTNKKPSDYFPQISKYLK